jgi:hypothetical protein
MRKTIKRQNWLLVLLTINLASTILHYTDNFIYFDRYPAPNWMNMHHVYLAWLILTPFAAIGYFLYKKHKYWLAYLCLFIYSNAGAASMGHYFYGSISDISLKMNVSIGIDVIAGIALDLFLFWSAFISQEWREQIPADN